MKKYAYVVILFEDDYLPNVMVIGNLFHKTNKKKSIDLICLVTNRISSEACSLIRFYYKYVVLMDYLNFNQYIMVWTKFNLTHYKEIFLIDEGTIIKLLKNSNLITFIAEYKPLKDILINELMEVISDLDTSNILSDDILDKIEEWGVEFSRQLNENKRFYLNL
jgi:predicted component of viral defense system (DUF524 family)